MEGKVVFHGGRWKIDFRRRQVGGYITHDTLSLRFYSKEHADEILTKIRNEIRTGTFDISNYQKLGIKQWEFSRLFEEYINTGYSKDNIKWSDVYKQNVECFYRRYYKPFFKSIDIRLIEERHLKKFFHTIPEQHSAYTKKTILQILKAFLTSFKPIRNKLLEFPMPRRLPKKEVNWISPEEQELILKHIKPLHRPLYRFLCWHGVRVGEVRALMWDCINFKEGTVKIKRAFSKNKLQEETKTKKERILPIYSEMIPILKSLRRQLGKDFVFKNQFGRPYGFKAVNDFWNKAVKDAGLSPVRLYEGTRHSCASQLLDAGARKEDIQQLLGHASIKTTEIYTHAKRKKLVQVIELQRKFSTI